MFQFIVPQIHRNVALDGCHHEAAHQGQSHSLSLMQEQFWWPDMARDLRNCIRKCGQCKKFEATPPVALLKPLACSRPGELLHVDFTSIKETVPLHQEPVIRNVMVMQDHFSKYVVAYVIKDQMACTAAETLRNGYFSLFGAPAYLISDQGKAFTGHLISNLCELYGVQKLRTSPYHAQTNGQVERMNQTIIWMIGKLKQDKKACWLEHLPEMLAAYNGTCSAHLSTCPVTRLFWKVAGVGLSGLSDYTGWVGLGRYYHWRLSELGQLNACPRLQGQPVPDGPIGRPSGRPLRRPAQTKASTSGASGKQQGRN